VAATLRIADHIAAGITEIEPLAATCGAHRDSLHRVLRHLVSKGVFEEPTPGRFALNDVARGLLDDGARLGLDLDGIGGRMAHAWGTLLSAVRTGQPAYHEVFGTGFWDDLDAHPKIAATFDALMGPGHGVPDPEVLLDAADWQSVRTVVDVGGGTGALLAEVLRAHPEVRGTLVDLPRTVAGSREMFESKGVADRVTGAGQSFFDPLPGGCDVYLLKNVLADWPDEEAAALLKRCAEAARPGGRVVVLGGVTPEHEASPELLMMVLVGGKNRTLEEFRALAGRAGLEVRRAGGSASGRYVVECEPI
jgi:SAM-dependent methyltransferase